MSKSTGRPPSQVTVKAATARSALIAIKTLTAVAADNEASAEARVGAATALLQHAADKSQGKAQ